MRTLKEVKDGLRTGRFAINILRLAASVADAETFTIGTDVFEIDTAAAPGAITAGNIRVDCNAGVTPTLASPGIVAAINGRPRLRAVAISVNEILVYTIDAQGPINLACTETLAGANNQWAAAAMYGGAGPSVKGRVLQQRAANATEVALGFVRFLLPFTPSAFIMQPRSSAGAIKGTYDGLTTISGNRIDVAVGATGAIVAGDIIALDAQE